MLIPVYRIYTRGIISYYCFDTETYKFLETYNIKIQRYYELLPLYDGLTFACMGHSQKIAVILGRVSDKYAISTGGTTILLVSKSTLLNFVRVNWYVDSIGRVKLVHGSIEDISDIFKNDTLIPTESFLNMDDSSSGEQLKIYGRSSKSGLYGIVKFPLSVSSKDIEYECLYHYIGKQLGIPVVRAELGVCNGKRCVLSVFEYKKSIDTFMTFSKAMEKYELSELELLNKLSYEDRQLYFGFLTFDYIMNQGDRHLRNLGLVNGKLYPLYDNGRCLKESIGSASMIHREAVRRNIKEMYKKNKYVKNIINSAEYVDMPDKYNDEKGIMLKNLNELRGIING